jgi:hypothetical protein
MPKEYTHWMVAERALSLVAHRAKSVHWENNANRASNAHRAAVFFGAIAPDLLFYYLHGPSAGHFQAVSRRLHGEGGADSFGPVRRYLDNAVSHGEAVERPSVRPAASLERAFLFGYLSHIAADTTFHPMVWHLAGAELAGHFALESTLDLYFMSLPEKASRNGFFPRRARLGEIVNTLLKAWPDLVEFTGSFIFSGQDFDLHEFWRCFRRALVVQWLFHSAAARLIVRGLSLLIPPLRGFVAAFYHARFRRRAGMFREPLAWRHPVSGAAASARVEELLEKAAHATLELWDAAAAGRLPIIGPSLDSGLPADADQTVRWLVEKPASLW